MRLFVVAKDARGVRALLVVMASEEAKAERQGESWRSQGFEVKTILAADLRDAMQSYPSWFEVVA